MQKNSENLTTIKKFRGTKIKGTNYNRENFEINNKIIANTIASGKIIDEKTRLRLKFGLFAS